MGVDEGAFASGILDAGAEPVDPGGGGRCADERDDSDFPEFGMIGLRKKSRCPRDADLGDPLNLTDYGDGKRKRILPMPTDGTEIGTSLCPVLAEKEWQHAKHEM